MISILKLLFPLFALSVLHGCQSYPDTPSRVISSHGNYSAISDCVYLAIENQGAWRKEDLPSVQRSRLLRGDYKYAAAKIEFSQRNQSDVEVTMWFSPTIRGEKFYPDMIDAAVRRCAQI